MKNIDTAFRHYRLFSILFLVACTIICCYTIYSSNKQEEKIKGKIYVLSNGKLLEALAMDRNIPVELRDHIKTFHQYFFTLSPDEKVIDQNISKALYLADGSAKREYENLKEASYYANIIASNISQAIEVDSITLNMNTSPYYFRCFARQVITRTTSIVTRSLVTEGYIRTGLTQSDNNVHGFLIERWNTIENRDIKTEGR
jgi:conjugative transposon TraK protein